MNAAAPEMWPIRTPAPGENDVHLLISAYLSGCRGQSAKHISKFFLVHMKDIIKIPKIHSFEDGGSNERFQEVSLHKKSFLPDDLPLEQTTSSD